MQEYSNFSTTYQENINFSHKVQTSFQGKRETPKRNVKEVIKKATMKKTNLMHTPNRKINSMMQKATSDSTEDKGDVVEKEDTLRSVIQGEALIKG